MPRIVKKTKEIFPDGRRVITIEYEKPPIDFTSPWITWPVGPAPGFVPGGYIPAGYDFTTTKIPCAFDNLPPGVYGLVCHCPKCSPTYLSSSGCANPPAGDYVYTTYGMVCLQPQI